MGLRINSNLEAFTAHRNMMLNSLRLSKSMEKLSSGLRINRAADDAAGLGISERMRGQISGLQQAQRNAQDGISLVATAEGSLQEIHSILQRVRELAVQYSNGTNDDAAKAAITAEVDQLNQEIERMVASASFNGIALLSSTAGAVLATLQVGPNDVASDRLAIAGINVNTSLGTALDDFVAGTVDLAAIDAAITAVSKDRSTFGAVQNRLEHTVNALGIYQENLMSAESRIRDVDMAQEIANMTRLQILQESSTAMLAQANSLHSTVLRLLE